jgi:hypothetical protein
MVALTGKTAREGRKMEATIREARLAGNFAEREEVVTSARYAENNLLSELPGIAFGLITPPYGLALLMASKFVDTTFSKALKAALPIYVIFFATIAFVIFEPDVVLWLPKHVFPESVGCFKSPAGTSYICPS